jgi:hypothetical protein
VQQSVNRKAKEIMLPAFRPLGRIQNQTDKKKKAKRIAGPAVLWRKSVTLRIQTKSSQQNWPQLAPSEGKVCSSQFSLMLP